MDRDGFTQEKVRAQWLVIVGAATLVNITSDNAPRINATLETGPTISGTVSLPGDSPQEWSDALDVFATGSAPDGVRVYPDTAGNGATAPPETSSLNYIPGRDIPNMVVVQLPVDRKVNFYSVSSATDMVVDIIGYIKAPAR